MLTTGKVINTLLANGWRLQPLSPGLLPCITNAPAGLQECPKCMSWQKETNFASSSSMCQSCDGYPHGWEARKDILAKRRFVCKDGHEKTGRNLYVNPKGVNICRVCRGKNQAAYRARQKIREAGGHNSTAVGGVN